MQPFSTSTVCLGRRLRDGRVSGRHPILVIIQTMGLKNDVRGWRDELVRLDTAVYSAIAGTPTPRLDRILRNVSRAADHSKLWLASAALLASAGGPRGRRAAVDGLTSVAVTSVIVNAILKPLACRRRPERVRFRVPMRRHVRMPTTHSFPSGHSASAFAFVAGIATEAPEVAAPLARPRRWSPIPGCTPACATPGT